MSLPLMVEDMPKSKSTRCLSWVSIPSGVMMYAKERMNEEIEGMIKPRFFRAAYLHSRALSKNDHVHERNVR